MKKSHRNAHRTRKVAKAQQPVINEVVNKNIAQPTSTFDTLKNKVNSAFNSLKNSSRTQKGLIVGGALLLIALISFIIKHFDTIKNKVSDAAQYVKEKVSPAAQYVKEKVSGATQYVKTKVSDAINRVKQWLGYGDAPVDDPVAPENNDAEDAHVEPENNVLQEQNNTILNSVNLSLLQEQNNTGLILSSNEDRDTQQSNTNTM